MAHEIEIDESTGRAAMVSGRNLDPWHRLGTVLPGGLTADQALEEAFLKNWDVRKVQAKVDLEQLTDDGVVTESVEIPGEFGLVRTNPFTKRAEPLGNPGGVVGTIYQPFQNEQAVEFMAAVTDQYSDAEFETAGSIRHGAQVFVSMKLKGFTVGNVDAINLYLVYLLNHGTGSNITFASHIRPVCANTVDAGMASARFTFRHSASIEGRHQEARESLQLAFGYSENFQAEAEKMMREPLDLGEFEKACLEIWPAVAEESPDIAKKRMVQRNYQLRQLFLFSETQEDIRGTRWAGYNAIIEYLDHVAPSRGKTEEAKSEARALRTIDGQPSKAQAFALLKV